MQNTQSKSGNVVSTKSVFDNSKDRTITSETKKQVPSPDTSTSLPDVDYNIIDDMKKVCANISMFERTKIMSQVLTCVLGVLRDSNSLFIIFCQCLFRSSLHKLRNACYKGRGIVIYGDGFMRFCVF